MIMKTMEMALATNKAVGVSANQVGSNKRIILIDAPSGFRHFMLNPVIVCTKGGTFTSKEGSLSHPGVFVSYVRFKQIKVEALDADFNPIRFKLKGLNACTVQHLIDRLNGVDFVGAAVKRLNV